VRLPPATILSKLLVAYVAPTLILFTVFAVLAYDLLRRDLDEELGTRLAAVAAATALHIRGGYLVDMDATEKPMPAAWSFTRRELEAALAATGVERMYVFTPDRTSLCDTQAGVPVGAKMNELELDRHELARVFAGTPTSSVLFRGEGGKLYKAGYAPVVRSERDKTIVAALRVEAPAAYFAELGALATRLITSGAVLAAVVILASFVVAARLTRPIRRLAADAARIGRGELDTPVASGGRDEIGLFGRTLDEMRAALRARDERLQMMLAGIAH
jgi:HAMP domain-containing protein